MVSWWGQEKRCSNTRVPEVKSHPHGRLAKTRIPRKWTERRASARPRTIFLGGSGEHANPDLPANREAAPAPGTGCRYENAGDKQAPARGLAPSGPASPPGPLPRCLGSGYSLAGGGEKRGLCIHGVLSDFSGLSALTSASSGSLRSPPTEKWPSGRGEDGAS